MHTTDCLVKGTNWKSYCLPLLQLEGGVGSSFLDDSPKTLVPKQNLLTHFTRHPSISQLCLKLQIIEHSHFQIINGYFPLTTSAQMTKGMRKFRRMPLNGGIKFAHDQFHSIYALNPIEFLDKIICFFVWAWSAVCESVVFFLF